MSGCRSEAGRLFQILGPATEKLLSPSRVFVLGTVRMLSWTERSWVHPESAFSHRPGTMELDLTAGVQDTPLWPISLPRTWPVRLRPRT